MYKNTLLTFEDALRRAEARHAAHVAKMRADGNVDGALAEEQDWAPFYARFLADEFMGIRIPMPTHTVLDTVLEGAPGTGGRGAFTDKVREEPCIPEYESCTPQVNIRRSWDEDVKNDHPSTQPSWGYSE